MKKVAVLSALVLALAALPGGLSAQSDAATVEWAQPMLGSWVATLATPDGNVPLMISVRDLDGDVVVVLGNEDAESDPIRDVWRSGDALVAAYEMDYQGMPINAEVSLELDGEELDTDWSFADGMYETSARATRR